MMLSTATTPNSPNAATMATIANVLSFSIFFLKRLYIAEYLRIARKIIVILPLQINNLRFSFLFF
jgi:hypothetical protein